MVGVARCPAAGLLLWSGSPGELSNHLEVSIKRRSPRAGCFMDHLGIMDDRKIQSFYGKSNHKMDHLGVPGLVNVYIANWKIHPNFSWENQLFLWSFSIAMLVITRGYPLWLRILRKAPYVQNGQNLVKMTMICRWDGMVIPIFRWSPCSHFPCIPRMDDHNPVHV